MTLTHYERKRREKVHIRIWLALLVVLGSISYASLSFGVIWLFI